MNEGNRRLTGLGAFLVSALVLMWAIWYTQNNLPAAPANRYDTECIVTRIVDGDTIECQGTVIRFRSIDAPEIWSSTGQVLSTNAGNQSRQALMMFLPVGVKIGLKLDSLRLSDVYGRVLADIWLLGLNNDSDIQQLMVAAGHATYREDIR